mmetsp:Transcript_44214/g.77091  ORF Transcript_44214/g.77091 Transcript_44214/m.77091 type:complete len:227 (+) Transcript_44214:248-928(+)
MVVQLGVGTVTAGLAVRPVVGALCVCVTAFASAGLAGGLLAGGGGRVAVGQVGVVLADLLPDQLLHALPRQLLVLELEREARSVDRLVVGAMQGLQERVLQGLFHGDTTLGVNLQHALQQVQCIRLVLVRVEHFRKGRWRLVRERVHEPFGSFGGDEVQVFFRGTAELVADEAQLGDIVLSGEQRGACEQLGEDAAHRPHVDRTAVLLTCEHDLRSAVPAGHHVLR